MSLLALGRSRRTDIFAGVFVLAGLAIVGFWATVRVLGPSLRGHEYSVYLDNVGGLKVGTPVLIAGYKVGLVKRMAPRWANQQSESVPTSNFALSCEKATQTAAVPEAQPHFQVILVIDKDWKITTDSQVRLENPSLLGQPVLAIVPGNGSALCPGSTIRFESQRPSTPDLAGLTEHADRVLATLGTFLKDLEAAGLPQHAGQLLGGAQQAVRQLGDTSTAWKAFVNDPTLQSTKVEISRSAAQLTALIQDARKLTQEAHEVAPALTGAVTELRPPLSKAAADLESAIRLTSTRLPGILADLERTAQDLSGLVSDLRANPASAIRGRAAETPVWSGERAH